MINGSPVKPTDFKKLSCEENQNHEAGKTADGLVHQFHYIFVILDNASADTISKARKQEQQHHEENDSAHERGA